MMRLILVSLAVPMTLVTLCGCPAETAPEVPADLTPEADAPATAKKGDSVALQVRLPADVDPNSVAYAWFQTYGWSVNIIDADTADAHFEAPSVPADQTLRFRVDVIASDGTIHSATVEVAVTRDLEYGLDTDADSEESAETDPYPQVRLVTSKGTILLQLDRVNAPKTVNNFLRYVEDGFYDGTIFHRVIAEFIIQGGGFEPGMVEKETRSPILNESDNGLENDRGTIAMARTNELDSATSQFYINVVDNDHLNATSGANGYAVFGHVLEDYMNVVDEISEVETESRTDAAGTYNDVPIEDVVLERADRLSDGRSAAGGHALSGG